MTGIGHDAPSALRVRMRPPSVPNHYLHRGRLVALLDEVVHGPVALVVAPAGAGKTVLASAWAASTSTRTAWLSLDEADRGGRAFWLALIGALGLAAARARARRARRAAPQGTARRDRRRPHRRPRGLRPGTAGAGARRCAARRRRRRGRDISRLVPGAPPVLVARRPARPAGAEPPARPPPRAGPHRPRAPVRRTAVLARRGHRAAASVVAVVVGGRPDRGDRTGRGVGRWPPPLRPGDPIGRRRSPAGAPWNRRPPARRRLHLARGPRRRTRRRARCHARPRRGRPVQPRPRPSPERPPRRRRPPRPPRRTAGCS